jgi:hypothetical protein
LDTSVAVKDNQHVQSQWATVNKSFVVKAQNPSNAKDQKIASDNWNKFFPLIQKINTVAAERGIAQPFPSLTDMGVIRTEASNAQGPLSHQLTMDLDAWKAFLGQHT